MPNIVKEEVDALTAKISVTITPVDYSPKLNSELAKYRKEAHIKGFRKGKTPLSFIKKMYGTAILGDVINNLLQKSVTDYLKDEELNILGQPIPADDQEEIEFDIKNLGDFEFKFDIGLAPEFEVQGIGTENSYTRMAIEVPQAEIDEQFLNLRKRNPIRNSVDENIESDDILTLNAEELTEEGGEIKENGWACTFTVLVNRMGSEAMIEEVKEKKKGDKITFDIYEIEKDTTEEHVKKYLLQVEEGDADREIGRWFEATISDVVRAEPAELNEEFFEKAFGDKEVNNEEEAQELIRQDIQKFYDSQSENVLYKDIRDRLMAENDLSLPDDFLKRWLVFSNEGMTLDAVEKEYDAFSENLRWSLVRSSLIKQFEVEVTEEEILEGFKDNVRQYFGGGQGNEFIVLNTANRLMADQEQVDRMYQELMTNKLFKNIREQVAVEDKAISKEDFDKELERLRSEMMDQQTQAIDESASEEVEGASTSNPEEATEEEITEDVG